MILSGGMLLEKARKLRFLWLFCSQRSPEVHFHSLIKTKKPAIIDCWLSLSGWQDSNLRPPAPKAGAITGLRYTPDGALRKHPVDVFSERASPRAGCSCTIKIVTLILCKIVAERPGFEPGQRLPVDRLAICSITTLAPLQ